MSSWRFWDGVGILLFADDLYDIELGNGVLLSIGEALGCFTRDMGGGQHYFVW
jgi:hypothetical protein